MLSVVTGFFGSKCLKFFRKQLSNIYILLLKLCNFFIFQLISEFGKNTTEKCWSDASDKSLSRNQGWELWNRPDRPPFSTPSMIHSFSFNEFVAKHKIEMREKYLLWSVRIQPFFVLKFIVWIFKQFDCGK